MLTDLQKRKLVTLFSVYDANNSGVLDQNDFERTVQKLAQLRDWQQSSSEYNELHTKYMLYWQGLQDVADQNRDEKVSLEEWFIYHDKLLSPEGNFEEVIESLSDLIFNLFNPDGSGKTTPQRWEEFFVVHNIPRVYVEYIFPRLDLNSDGTLSKDEVLELLHQFYFSDDPEAPGNLLFGPHV
ncbi:MAG TPA: EF-hand domain-containing protein [Phormidium sp.]